jgi:hypothetical protein
MARLHEGGESTPQESRVAAHVCPVAVGSRKYRVWSDLIHDSRWRVVPGPDADPQRKPSLTAGLRRPSQQTSKAVDVDARPTTQHATGEAWEPIA